MKLMASPCSFEFQVNRLEPKLIRPARPTPREVKLLSDIDDQEGLRFQVPVIMSYKNNHDQIMKENHDYYDPIMVIKEAVGRALVYYYPLAGRLREGPNRKLMVDCNGEGVLFIEANADVTLEQLGNTILPPCPFLEDFLSNVPGSDGILGCPLLLLQVTRLKCGGFIFALRVNHTMCDAPGLIQFFNAVGEMAQGVDAPSIPPVWRRELLNARDPPRITCMHHEYEQVFNSQGSFATMDQTNVTQLSLFFGPNEIRALRKQAPPHLSTTCSKFELITACLWKCRTLAFEMNREDVVRLSFTINARGKNYYNIHLPLGYYGNAFAFPAAVSKVEALSKNPLGYALELVKKTKAKMSGDYIRSVADLMVIRGRPLYSLTGNDFIVSDTTRARFGEVNFGWGKPVVAGPAKALSIISFYIHHKNKKDEDGILVPICLPLSSVDRFQHELKRMTLEPLEEIEHISN